MTGDTACILKDYLGFFRISDGYGTHSAPLFKTEREAVEYLFPEVVAEISASRTESEFELDIALLDAWNEGYDEARAIYDAER